MPETFFDDEHFQDSLVALLSCDSKSLRECAYLLSADDFVGTPGMPRKFARWVVADQILEHFKKYHEPAGLLLRSEILDHVATLHMPDKQVVEIKEYLKHLKTVSISAPGSVIEKVVRFKRQRLKASALAEMVELQSTGSLTDDRWYEICKAATCNFNGGPSQVINYMEEVDSRIERRKQGHDQLHKPWFYIDPLDSITRGIARQQLGLILGPTGRGKSLMLAWIAVAYVAQQLNVLYITLEDPKSMLEDRLDSIITKLPIKRLGEFPQTLKKKFSRFKSMTRKQLRIVDGVGKNLTVQDMDHIVESSRNEGFMPDALVTDYDHHITPSKRRQERRFEFDQIYQDMKDLASKYDMLSWTAAQTQRNTQALKLITADRVGEDYGKVQKSFMTIGLGRSDWTEDALYMYIAKHKSDRQFVGCDILPDLERMLIFDRESTTRAYRQNAGLYNP